MEESTKSLVNKLLSRLISQALPALAMAGLYVVWDKASGLYNDLTTIVREHARLEMEVQELKPLKDEVMQLKIMLNYAPSRLESHVPTPEPVQSSSPSDWNDSQVRDYLEQRKR